ncbi:MAG: hypothetical protein LBG79_01080 [Spirochaetaceae bacterium]|jgi:hypothetical protein|nr:hypothetical protein [Spirochaetaceae bacterium]GMO16849.1 MAG: hypothetical protein Pg6A_02960 [Termitinemataceae bacterium]
MKKKVFLGLAILMLAAGGVFAQEKAKNTIAGGLDLGLFSGVSIDYERMLNDKFALGIEAGYDLAFFIIPDIFADVQVKWYPWAGKFYADLGAGYAQIFYVVPAIMITAGAGWKIDIGKPNGFILDLGAAIDYNIMLGSLSKNLVVSGPGINARAKVQIGYSW